MGLNEDLRSILEERSSRVRGISIKPSLDYPDERLFDVRFHESSNFSTVITVNAKEARVWGEALIALAKEHNE